MAFGTLKIKEKATGAVRSHLGCEFGPDLKTMCRQTLRTEGPAAGTPALSCRHLPFLPPTEPALSRRAKQQSNPAVPVANQRRKTRRRPAAGLHSCRRSQAPGYVRAVVRHGFGVLIPRTRSHARGVHHRAISRSCTYRTGAGSAIPALVICTIQSLSRLMAIRVDRRRWPLRLNARSRSRRCQ
jgi:hypothetical protein